MTRVAYRLDGADSAPVVVLSSSLGTTVELWEPQLEALTGRFRVLRYDHRGHGGSDVPPGPYSVPELTGDVVELLDHLGLERVSFCGLSLGGVVGMCLASAAPERVDRLVLACTSARFGTEASWRERAALVRAEGIAPIADAVLARWFTPELHATSPELVGRYRELLVQTPAEGYAACCDALAGWDFRARLGAVRAPTLVVAGAQDPSAPVAEAELLARGTGASLVVLERAAHLASVEQPEAFNEALVGHLSSDREAAVG